MGSGLRWFGRGALWAVVLGGACIGGPRAEEPEEVLRRLLSARAACASEGAGAREASVILAPRKAEAAKGRPVVLAEQPFWDAQVVILVYDAAAAGKGAVTVEVREPGMPVARVALAEQVKDSGLFTGSTPVEGSHSTRVQVDYAPRGRPAAEPATVFMAFH